MNAKKISTDSNGAEFPESVKIIQIIQDLDPQGFYSLLGLGDDGVVYFTPVDTNRWRVYVPLKFCEEVNNEA